MESIRGFFLWLIGTFQPGKNTLTTVMFWGPYGQVTDAGAGTQVVGDYVLHEKLGQGGELLKKTTLGLWIFFFHVCVLGSINSHDISIKKRGWDGHQPNRIGVYRAPL